MKGTLHWVSARHALPVEVRLYDRLFAVPRPETGDDVLLTQLNPDSLVTLNGWIEPASTGADRYQFERQGFFFLDPIDSTAGRRAFNRTVTLRDSWVKESAVEAPPRPAVKSAPKVAVVADGVVGDPLGGLDDATRARAARYRDAYQLPVEQARLLAAAEVAPLFDEALAAGGKPAAVGKWIVNELPREAKDRAIASLPFGGAELAELATLVEDGAISWTAGKEILAQMVARGGRPRALMTELGLEQVEDESAIVPVVERLLAEHPDNVAAYRSGKTTLLGWFVGQAMKSTGGKAKPELLQRLLRERL